MYMHGRVKKEGEDRLFPQKITSRATGFGQHMQSVPSPRISVEGKSNSLVVSTATDTVSSFSKDGRKISVGDCALFKPPHDSPPFIGVICSLVFSEDKTLQLGVTWLYRPAEVKLGKGFFLDAAPNEIFYSFHKDEKIPAAALLHPCKVAFLPKGVELPKGISSFVCRRVYDINNECLWWLTDKDYLDERQEEVNKLLNRTQKEMEQAGGCSPTETSAASHLKSASDNLQNSVTSAPCQLKGKKRDRSDQSSDHAKREHPSKADDGDSGTPRSGNRLVHQSSDHVKREHPSKADDGDSGTPRSGNRLVHQSSDHVKREHPSKADDGDSGTPRSGNRLVHPSKADDGDSGTPRSGNRLRWEITKITEKGGLIDSVLVEKLVELIKPRADRKLDLGIRSMVSGVIAATDRCDCLSQFVQLKGLSVLDEWLQDVNKGRLRDSCGSRDDDKSVEEFLFVLLRALDRLPVNLHALQTCNIGRSVNHLRSHKNMEIQKKARSLVDIWKKRVEAEMNVIDSSKSGSPRAAAWPSKSRLPEVHGGRTSGGSCDVSVKSSVSPPSESKAASIKAFPGEATSKPACSSPEPVKSASLTATEKEIKNRTVPNNGTDVPLSCREDKNCTSASHNVSVKEDSRFRAAGTVNISKMPMVGSRHRKSVNGFTETLEPGSLKEMVSRRISLVHENTTHEKSPQSAVISEKTFTRSVADSGNHKLIVKIPNPSRTAAQCSIGVSGDPSVMNGLVSPVSDQDSKNCETYQANVASHDRKDLQAGFDVGDRCSAALHDELSKSVDESRKSSEGSRSPCSSLEKDVKVVKKLREASSSAMDALIESCAKYSEESASTSPGEDDVGMNLLASVAAREEENFLGDGSMSKTCPADNLPRNECTTDAATAAENGKMAITAPCVLSREETHQSKELSIERSRDIMGCPDLSQGMKVIADCSPVIDEKSSNAFSCISEEYKKGLGADKKLLDEKQSCLTAEVHHFPDTEAAEVRISKGVTGEDCGKQVEKSSSSALGEIDSKKGCDKNLKVESKPALIPDAEILQPTVSCIDACDQLDEIDAGQAKLVIESAFPSVDAKKYEKLKTSNLSADEMEKKGLSTVAETQEVDSKLDFDLNEALLGDDGNYDEQPNSGISGDFASYPASIALASPAKGNFVPPVVDLLRNKGDTGWKGSAATSAFRPAEPRKVSTPDGSTSKHRQRPFDIDLNVADESVLEDITSQHSVDHVKIQHNSRNEFNGFSPRGMDLDLNRVDDSNFMMQYPASSSQRHVAVPNVALKPLLFPANDVKRDFDLNNGPGFDDGVAEQQSSLNQLFMRSSHSNLSPFSGLRPNGGVEIGNLSNRFPHPNPYSSVLPDRGEHQVMVAPPQRILSSSSNGNPFMSDMYRAGAVLPSSPYQMMFPFGATLPNPSGAFSVGSSSSTSYLDHNPVSSAGRLSMTPTVNPHFLSPNNAVASQYPKPFMIGQPFMTGLDLNAGPGILDVENREGGFMSPQRLLFASGSNTRVEDQGRTYSMTGGGAIKRKEPEGGLDRENLRYKQPSWH